MTEKKNCILSLATLSALFIPILIVHEQQDPRPWWKAAAAPLLFPRAGCPTWCPLPQGRDAQPHCSFTPALQVSGGLLRMPWPLCVPCPPSPCRQHRHAQGMCLMSRTRHCGAWEQPPAEDGGWGRWERQRGIVLFEGTCVKPFYFSLSLDGKRPFVKRHFCLIYS